jgi:hypothetical protein
MARRTRQRNRQKVSGLQGRVEFGYYGLRANCRDRERPVELCLRSKE